MSDTAPGPAPAAPGADPLAHPHPHSHLRPAGPACRSRRALFTAALAVAGAAAATVLPGGSATARAANAGAATGSGAALAPAGGGAAGGALVDNRFWTSYDDWSGGSLAGVRAVAGGRAGLVIDSPAGRAEYTDPHTGVRAAWEYASWTSPEHTPAVPATEVVPSWNADTPAGTWITVELQARYGDGTRTPWYVMARWAAGEGDIRRTSLDGQRDGRSTVGTDTLAVDDPAGGVRLTAYRLRLTLHRKPGSGLTPTVWRAGAMASDIPDRFTVPASTPGPARELAVPRYSQHVHDGQYPEYGGGGEAWCSPTSSQMVLEFWGRRPAAAELAWVNPSYADPQVCHAARRTFDHAYDGCGNWPFNTAYAAAHRDMNAVVTRLRSTAELEGLIAAGLPVITSQSFLKEELTGAGYGTAGHLMAVIGFTSSGDVVAADPASASNTAVRRVYRRREWENIWLRTRRKDAAGQVKSGSGGVCYVFWPQEATADQRRVLDGLGIR
ncbi:peptidase C39 family protein [Streptomyces sp. ODS05-4]|uniref:peptidase C39 family protein n=1 Tax=Streptomyces sp. ODS05-4 TaxID=2944939 RepID=UPI00210EC937|nr:peptidase C39 family protein [Streptomyces sp. ODS05-4]